MPRPARRNSTLPLLHLSLISLLALPAPREALAEKSATASDEMAAPFAGGWCGEARHGGQVRRLALHVPEAGDQPVTVDIPAMDAWGIAIGGLKATEAGLEIGAWPLTWEGERARLTGSLPAWLVPRRTIPVEFERCDPPAREEPDWNYPAPEIAWSLELDGAVWAGLELDRAANRVLVATVAGTLTALEMGSGERAWTWSAGGAIRAQPSVIGDAVYVASDDGRVSKLARLSGRLLWQAEIGTGPERLGPESPDSKWDRYGSSVVEAGGRLFVGSRDGALYCLDPETGERLWRFQTEDILQATPATSGERVFVASFDGGVTALSAANGEPLWRFDAQLPVPADLAVADGVVLAGSRTYDLHALAEGSGEPVWSRFFWFSWIDSPPNVVSGVAYVGSSDVLLLSALSTRTGDAVWETLLPGWSWARPAVAGGGVFTGTVGSVTYVGARAGTFVAVDRASGRIRWLYPAPAPEEGQWGFGASAAATEDLVFAADLGGRIYAFRARS